ncbi:MAG TPA: Crp/Fnr family transcriptional regulator [Rhizomicrobium sp.]|jgi:CRP-like cAMP-binding protein|nr:Crp/Fnr family transcriptional regulator [Rhizomicrobium sp.]
MPRLRSTAPGTLPDLAVKRLGRYAHLNDAERALLQALPDSARDVPMGQCLIAEGERLDTPRLLLAGWACRMRTFPDGRRQIFEFILPGEMYGLCLRPQAVALSTLITLTPAVIADATPVREALQDRNNTYPNLHAALSCVASLDEAYLLNQLIRIGRQSAYERVAHLILELRERLAIVGLAHGDTIPVPLTQEMLADALGLSIVHLNRTLQQLRRENLITFKSGILRLIQPDRLADIADFRPPKVTKAAA